MPSITLMMSTILRDDSLIEPMVSTTSATTAPPRLAIPAAAMASWLAWRALSAFCLTVLVSSSIDEAVSSSEPACCSVRDDRSRLPAAISDEAVAMLSVPLRTWLTMPTRLLFILPRAVSSAPVSSFAVVATVCVRSPAATVSASASAWRSGRVMPVVSSHEHNTPNATANRVSRLMTVVSCTAEASICLAVASMLSRCMVTSSCSKSW
ncbi:hypothetical protein D3C72_1364300 [compost metagenome]